MHRGDGNGDTAVNSVRGSRESSRHDCSFRVGKARKNGYRTEARIKDDRQASKVSRRDDVLDVRLSMLV